MVTAGSDRFLELLDEDDLVAVCGASLVIHVKAGDALFLEGDRSERVILVEEGLARVSAVAPTGDELLVAFRGPGDILGEQSVLDGGEHGQTVRAVTDLSARSIPATVFLDLLSTHPRMSIALHRVHARRLREADGLRLEQASIDVTGRIARRLVGLHRTTGALELDISHQELASWIGASREAVTKGIASLRRRGLVATSRGRITLTDPNALGTLARL